MAVSNSEWRQRFWRVGSGLFLLAALAAVVITVVGGDVLWAQGEGEGGEGAEGESGAGEQAVLLHAGSEAPYVHNINLYAADGSVIDPANSSQPYSPTQTCGKCHNVNAVTHGWHHNAADPDFDQDGRPGEPFFWTNAQTATQLPVSERDWPGVYGLDPLGLSPWDFTTRFGGFTPGGGLGSKFNDQGADDPEARWNLTGPLQADCLSCHLDDGSYNFLAWNEAIDKHNFKWAPSAAVPWATVNGTMTEVPEDYDPVMTGFGSDNPMPKVDYKESEFNGGRIRLQISNDVPNDTCYRCHSKRPVGENAMPRWHRQEDVHMAQGMNCVDCHRNAIDHMTTRNYEDDPALDSVAAHTLSCKGCHTGTSESELGEFGAGGRLAAPRPEHKGIPPLHFRTMTCTSCHAGSNPTETGVTQKIQTSMAHQLGLSSEYRNHLTLPHMVSPLFIKNNAGKIAPHRAVWPAFWGIKQPKTAVAKETDADAAATAKPAATTSQKPAASTPQTQTPTASPRQTQKPAASTPQTQTPAASTQPAAQPAAQPAPIKPLPPNQVASQLEDVLPAPEHEGQWRSLTRSQIAQGLAALQGGDWGDSGGDSGADSGADSGGEGTLVYVSGGRVYQPAKAAAEAEADAEKAGADSPSPAASDTADQGSAASGGLPPLPGAEGPGSGQGGEPADAADGEGDSVPELTVIENHPAAAPYTWPIAHDVRPAVQALGAGGCKDCHSSDGATDFTMTAAPGWAQVKAQTPTLARKAMYEMRGKSRVELTTWNLLFKGRTLFKGLAVVSALVVAGLLLAYAVGGVRVMLDRYDAARRRK